MGEGQGVDWQEMVTFQNCGKALVILPYIGKGNITSAKKAKKPAWRGCVGSLMAEMKHNLQCGHLGC